MTRPIKEPICGVVDDVTTNRRLSLARQPALCQVLLRVHVNMDQTTVAAYVCIAKGQGAGHSASGQRGA